MFNLGNFSEENYIPDLGFANAVAIFYANRCIDHCVFCFYQKRTI